MHPPADQGGSDENQTSGSPNSQITQAVFEKEKGEYQATVMKQILWVNGMRYELQEIYGIGNSVDGDVDANDPGKECVIYSFACQNYGTQPFFPAATCGWLNEIFMAASLCVCKCQHEYITLISLFMLVHVWRMCKGFTVPDK